MAVTQYQPASQPFLYLDFGVDLMFEAVEIDSIGSWDDVVVAVWTATTIRIVDFFT